MLAGRRLFKGGDRHETLSNVLSMPVPPPSSMQPGRAARRSTRSSRAPSRAIRRSATSTAEEMAEALEDALRALKYQTKLLPTASA